MKTTDELVRIAGAGGGLDLTKTSLTTDDLVRIATAASGKGNRIIINGQRTTDELVRIAEAGQGCVMIFLN